MTTAFVLGGGGVLGAAEVGMLRALFEVDVTPDLVLGTSVGALNGAMVARDPTLAVIERLTDLWQDASTSPRHLGDRPLADRTSCGLDRDAPVLLDAHADAAGGGVRRDDLRGAAGAVPGVRGQHRARGRALVRLRPARPRDHGERRRPRSAAAGQGGRRALPRRRHRELDPARPGRRPRCRPGVRAPGRPDRPAAQAAARVRGRWPGSRSRSPAATGSRASWPRCPTMWRCTCSPRAAPRLGTTRCSPTATSPASARGSRRATKRRRDYLASAPVRRP